MYNQIKNQVYEFIVENFLFGERDGLQDEESLLENGIIDSIGILELVSFVEESFDIQMKDDEIIPDNLGCIEDITRYIQKKMNGSAFVSSG